MAVRVALVDQVVRVARSVAIDDIIDHPQGVAVRRTRINYPVVETIALDAGPPRLPGERALAALAVKRCGTLAAISSWAIVFAVGNTPVCCLRDTRFVIHLRSGWWVY